MTRTTVQLQVHDVCNCPINAQIRAADDQSDSRILIVTIRHVIGARSRGCPITGNQFEFFVVGYPRDSQVNYARLNGFICTVSYSFQDL